MDEKGQSQKENILKAAFELFASKGFAEVGVQEVCDAAAISKPTLYYWFGSKDGLLDALVASVSDPYLAELTQASKYTNDIILDTRRIVRTVFTWAQARPEEYRWILSGFAAPLSSRFANAFRPLAEKQHLVMRDYFLSAANQHGNMKGKEEFLALSLPGVMQAYVLGASLSGQKLGEAMVMQATQHFLYGVFS